MEQFNTHFVVFDPGGHNFTLNSIRKSSLEPLIKILLLFDQTGHEWSLGGPLQKLFKWF